MRITNFLKKYNENVDKKSQQSKEILLYNMLWSRFYGCYKQINIIRIHTILWKYIFTHAENWKNNYIIVRKTKHFSILFSRSKQCLILKDMKR